MRKNYRHMGLTVSRMLPPPEYPLMMSPNMNTKEGKPKPVMIDIK